MERATGSNRSRTLSLGSDGVCPAMWSLAWAYATDAGLSAGPDHIRPPRLSVLTGTLGACTRDAAPRVDRGGPGALPRGVSRGWLSQRGPHWTLLTFDHGRSPRHDLVHCPPAAPLRTIRITTAAESTTTGDTILGLDGQAHRVYDIREDTAALHPP
jgi:hypothetical protein